MSDSILVSVRENIGDIFSDNPEDFDAELITHINTVFMILNQMGVGPKRCFSITGETETWDDFSTEDYTVAVRSYIPLKIKQSMFDPSTSSAVGGTLERTIAELEARLNFEAEYRKDEEVSNADE